MHCCMQETTHPKTVHYDGLEALRGIAAVAIVIYHTAAFSGAKLPAGLSFVTNFFWLGVQLFYVLSAFCLCLGYFDRLQSRDEIRRYAVRRFFRIAPLFYVLIPIYVLASPLTVPPTFDKVLVNLLFMFQIAPRSGQEIVWSSWSIALEMQFYLLLPVLVSTLTNLRRATIGFAVSVAASIAYQVFYTSEAVSVGHLWKTTPVQLCFFVLGIAAFHLFRQVQTTWPERQRVVGVSFAALALGICCALWLSGKVWFSIGPVAMHPYVLSLAFVAVIIWQVTAPSRLLVNRITEYLGKRSYSIYLLHGLVLLKLVPFIREHLYGGEPGLGAGLLWPYIAAVALALAATLALAEITYRFIEMPFKLLGGRLTPRRPAAAAVT